MKKKALIAGVAITAGILAAAGCWWHFFGGGQTSEDENVVYVNSVENLMNPGSGNGSINRFAGVVETQEKLEIQPNSEKTIKEIYVEEGQEVEVGTPLFAYDTEGDQENLEKAQLDLERISNAIGNKYNEIAALEKEKKNAGSDAQLDYTIQIQSAEMELKQSEYERKSKQVEIQKLQDSIDNAEVLSEMAGVVKSIRNNSEESYYYGESQAFMTIIAMGDFRVKGKINELNMGSIMPGQPVIVHSRVDADQYWTGTMGEVDMENPGNDSGSMYYSSGDSTTQSNSYPFYVNLDSSEGLMLGQHVYIEIDNGQEEERAGIWLDEYMICDPEGSPYVWADNGNGKLEKRAVVLGQYDAELFQYEIADGLVKEDLVTFPEDGLEEGMPTAPGENGQMGQSNPAGMSDEEMLDGEMLDGEMMDGEMLEGGMTDGEMLEGGMTDGEMLEGGMTDGEMLEGEMTDGEMLEGEMSDEGAADGGVTDGPISEEENAGQEVLGSVG